MQQVRGEDMTCLEPSEMNTFSLNKQYLLLMPHDFQVRKQLESSFETVG